MLMLFAFQSYSQSGTPRIEITTGQAKEAIRNAQRVESLTLVVSIQSQQIVEYRGIVEELKGSIANKEAQLELLGQNYSKMESLYRAERKKKTPGYSLKDFLNDVGLVGLGVVAGVVLIL